MEFWSCAGGRGDGRLVIKTTRTGRGTCLSANRQERAGRANALLQAIEPIKSLHMETLLQPGQAEKYHITYLITSDYHRNNMPSIPDLRADGKWLAGAVGIFTNHSLQLSGSPTPKSTYFQDSIFVPTHCISTANSISKCY